MRHKPLGPWVIWRTVVASVTVLCAAGCVTTSRYDAKVAQNRALERWLKASEARLNQKEAELARVRHENRRLRRRTVRTTKQLQACRARPVQPRGVARGTGHAVTPRPGRQTDPVSRRGGGAGGSASGSRRSGPPLHSGMYSRAPTVQGLLPPAVVRRTLQTHANALHRCVEKRLKGRPGLFGRVTIRFTIGRMGWVAAARIAKTTLRDKVAERCLINRIRRIRFPKPKRGFVVVHYPLNFKLTRAGRRQRRLLRSVKVRGGISPRVVRQELNGRAPALRNCYTMLGMRLPLEARLRFVVGSKGRISQVKALGPVARRKRLWTCVAQRLRLLRLPAPRGGPATVTVSLKFVGK